ncbi:MAG: hydrogenase maturation protease [Bacteroidetes bacterium]|nr:hydrogenase maturation protease [Bacteroidota bacterium]MCW5894972.1 hydrogenase maturation protease [Bacteroidota bacterium]
MNRTLVIGYGNKLRRDDGAGPLAAERLAAAHPDVDCLSSQQLTPEMAEVIAHYDRVLFVDASVETSHLRWSLIQPRIEQMLPDSHSLSPQRLVELAIELYGECPQQAELVELPACDFDFGFELSPLASEMVERFVRVFPATQSELPEGMRYS